MEQPVPGKPMAATTAILAKGLVCLPQESLHIFPGSHITNCGNHHSKHTASTMQKK